MVELANGGTDLIRTTVTSYALFDTVENLAYTGTQAFLGDGNGPANTITGGAGRIRSTARAAQTGWSVAPATTSISLTSPPMWSSKAPRRAATRSGRRH